jgi:hypothetical protein
MFLWKAGVRYIAFSCFLSHFDAAWSVLDAIAPFEKQHALLYKAVMPMLIK